MIIQNREVNLPPKVAALTSQSPASTPSKSSEAWCAWTSTTKLSPCKELEAVHEACLDEQLLEVLGIQLVPFSSGEVAVVVPIAALPALPRRTSFAFHKEAWEAGFWGHICFPGETPVGCKSVPLDVQTALCWLASA